MPAAPPVLTDLIPLLAMAISACVGALFLMSAMAKLRHPDEWVRALVAYRLLPDAMLFPVARVFPWIEGAVALVLLSGMARVLAMPVAAGLLSLMALAMAINLLRGRSSIDCGCDPGGMPRPIGWMLVLRNGALALVLIALMAVPAPVSFAMLLLSIVAGLVGFSLLRAYAYIQSFGHSAAMAAGAPAHSGMH